MNDAKRTAVEELNQLHAEIVGAFNSDPSTVALAAFGEPGQLQIAQANQVNRFHVAALKMLAERIDAIERRLSAE